MSSGDVRRGSADPDGKEMLKLVAAVRAAFEVAAAMAGKVAVARVVERCSEAMRLLGDPWRSADPDALRIAVSDAVARGGGEGSSPSSSAIDQLDLALACDGLRSSPSRRWAAAADGENLVEWARQFSDRYRGGRQAVAVATGVLGRSWPALALGIHAAGHTEMRVAARVALARNDWRASAWIAAAAMRAMEDDGDPDCGLGVLCAAYDHYFDCIVAESVPGGEAARGEIPRRTALNSAFLAVAMEEQRTSTVWNRRQRRSAWHRNCGTPENVKGKARMVADGVLTEYVAVESIVYGMPFSASSLADKFSVADDGEGGNAAAERLLDGSVGSGDDLGPFADDVSGNFALSAACPSYDRKKMFEANPEYAKAVDVLKDRHPAIVGAVVARIMRIVAVEAALGSLVGKIRLASSPWIA